jgi:ankyrin repeat protein
MMQTIGTGKYNYRSLGIKKIRRINVSRGGREGNNALVKDTNCEGDNGELSEKMMEWDTPASIVTSVINAEIQVQANQVLNDTVHAVRHGNNDLAEAVMSKYAAKFNMCWGTLNHHHIEALAKGGEKKWAKNPVRLVSVQKKGPKGMTPLHCACSNPDVGPLKHLFGVCPDVNLGDDEQRKLAHYAAACKGLGPLKFLLDNGANLEDTNKMGMTPLIVAAEVGRAENVEFIIKCIKEKQEAAGGMDAAMIKKFGVAGVNRPMRNSWCAVHHACCNGHLDVVKVLIKYEADFEKSLNTLFDGKSALMLAAARGHVDIVEYLFDFVKTAKFDRYKRTALTHAIMNGSSNVASFLLHKGVDPNRPDTSGNTPLMYACAYGWYHCTKLLVDAGAQINAANEWKLTPVSVAMLKGHTGISKYLLDMPGVDINFRDDKGRTVLVTMLANLSTEKPLTQELVREIKDMVERRGADPKIADNDNMNALHFLCQYNGYPEKSCDEQINEKVKEKFRKKWNNQKKLLDEMTAFLLDKGVSTLDIDKNGYMPVARAFEAPIDDMKRKNYDIIQRILKKMVSEALTRPSQSLNVDKKKANIWHTFTANISLVGINEESFIYTSLNTIFNNLAKCDSIVPSLASVMNAPVASSNFTPLHQLCATYAAINDFKETEYHGDLKDVQYSDLTWDESTGHLSNMSSLVDLFRDLIFALANRCKLDYDIINTFEGETKTTTFSVLTPLSLVEWKEEQHTAFKTMLKHTRNVDYTDGEGRTQLVLATRSNNTKVIKAWIDAGADINLIFESELSQKVNVPEGDVGASDEFDPDETVTLKSCPLIEAVLKANLEIVRHLISAGVDTKSVGPVSTDSHQRSYYNYVIFVAVSSCIAQRKNKERTNILKALLNAGVSINTTDNFTGKSALHFAVNSSTDGADQNLDLEIALLRNNSDVFAKDFRERLALHHCFVKVGKHLDNTRTDPIEVCSMLVEAMNGKQIDNVDAYGCSPLHYAAYRGATVCCLLLLEKGADIEAVDHKGNTPLAYSVFGGHEGCALVLLQKGANLNVKIHPNLTDTPDVVDKFSVHQFSFIPKHFDQEKDKSKEPYSLFQGLVQNNWLGITYMALQKLESFGMSYAKAVEVAFVMQKVQFAKTLIGKQASVTKLKETVSNGRNLVCSLAFECKATSDPDVQVDILELLTSAGVSIHQSEDEGSSPLHFACLRHNIELIKALLLAKAEPSFPNQYNLTPLGSIFWNFERDSSNMRKCVNLLMNDGADINIMMPFKEFSYLLDGCVPRARSETNYFKTKSGDLNLTPLIIAVIHRDEEMVKLLMTHASSKVDVNLADKKGMTPIMHAVKTNDIRIVLRLLDKGGELPLEPKTDKMQSIQKIINMDLSKLVTSGVNVDAQDNCGYNAIHHLIELSTSTEGGLKATYDNEEVLQLLLRLGISATTPVTENCGQKTALEMAEEVGAVKIAAKLRSTFKLQGRLPFVPPEVDDAIDWEGTQVYDIVDDAHRMLRKLEHEADKAGKAELAKKKRKAKSGAGLFMSLGYPVMKLARKSSNSYEDEDDDDNDDAEDEEDEKEEEREEEEREEEDQEEEESEEDGNEYVNGVKDARREKPTGCIVGLGGTIYDDRALVMTKIDVRQGAFGMYNYYRMQVKGFFSCLEKQMLIVPDVSRYGRRSTRIYGFSSPTGEG